jgi:hypothetical protein
MSGAGKLDFWSVLGWLLPCTVWLRTYDLKKFLVVRRVKSQKAMCTGSRHLHAPAKHTLDSPMQPSSKKSAGWGCLHNMCCHACRLVFCAQRVNP